MRRGSGEGSIRQRSDGRWEGTLRLAGGRRKSVYGKTQREVLEKLTRVRRDRELGLPTRSERTTAAAYLARWLDSARPALAPRTWQRYEQLVRVHALPVIGQIPLARLSPQDLQALYAERLTAGSAPATVHQLHAILHHALDQAAEWGLVARNVASVVTPPRAARAELRTFSPDQARTFLDSVSGDRLEALYVLALTTGMRQGELLALRWSDVDLEGRAARVRSTLYRPRGGGYVFAPPKTPRSRRQVALTQAAVAALRRHRIRQAEEWLAIAAVVGEDARRTRDELGVVFANELGAPLRAARVARAFHAAVRRAGLPRIRFHDLRHTAATLMLGRGVHPKVASEMLGHSTIATTLDLYSHVAPTMQRQAADELDAVLKVTS